MIPKIIHYCWFGRGEMPELVMQCIASWHEHMPDWEYRLWDEDALAQAICQPILNPSLKGRTIEASSKSSPEGKDFLPTSSSSLNEPTSNFSLDRREECWLVYMPRYVQEAYAAKKYAFVSDYVRLWALEREGGLYMDVDFEVYKPFDDLMTRYEAFAGYEGSKYHPVMMGVLAANPHHPWIQGMLQTYEERSFIKDDGTYDMTPNTGYFRQWMCERGFIADGKEKDFMGVHILPVEYFCPVLTTGENLRCDSTYCEHKGLHSWSNDGGWKAKVLKFVGQKWKVRLIKMKRQLFN